MTHYFLNATEEHWLEVITTTPVQHIYNEWLSAYNNYENRVHNDGDLEVFNKEYGKSFLRHITISIFHYRNDEDCAYFLTRMLEDQQASVFTGHWLLYLLEENVRFFPDLLATDVNNKERDPEFLLFHSLMHPEKVSISGQVMQIETSIKKDVIHALGAIEGLLCADRTQLTFSPKPKALRALITLFRYNAPMNVMWVQLFKNHILNNVDIYNHQSLFADLVEHGLFADKDEDTLDKDTSDNMKAFALKTVTHGATSDVYMHTATLLEKYEPKGMADAITAIMAHLTDNEGFPNTEKLLQYCHEALSAHTPKEIVAHASQGQTVTRLCKYYGITPSDALEMAKNKHAKRAALAAIGQR